MGMSFSRLFTMDTDAEENGKWFNDILNDGSNVNVKVRRLTSTYALKVQQDLLVANKQYMDDKGKLPPDKDQALMYDLVAKALLAGWTGVLDDNGVEIEYSQVKGEEFCAQYKDFRHIVLGLSQKMDNYRAVVTSDISKN